MLLLINEYVSELSIPLSSEVPFFGQVSIFLLGFFFFLELLVQELDPKKSSRSNIFPNNILGNWLELSQNLFNSSFHNLVLGVDTVFPVNVLKDFFKMLHLLQKVVWGEREPSSRECADPWRVGLAWIGSILCFAAKLGILVAELVGQKPRQIFQALLRAVKTLGRIKIFRATACLSHGCKVCTVDFVCWKARFFLLVALRDGAENLKFNNFSKLLQSIFQITKIKS